MKDLYLLYIYTNKLYFDDDIKFTFITFVVYTGTKYTNTGTHYPGNYRNKTPFITSISYIEDVDNRLRAVILQPCGFENIKFK